ncbi:MAG: YdcF family protein [Saprospiraceae bacterium]
MNDSNAKLLYQFLSPRDSIQKVDLIMGFGHFDMRIPEECIAHYKNGFGKNILFTGGVGAGSGDFDQPESIAFLSYVKEKYTAESYSNIILETESTNTGENVAFSIQLLQEMGLLSSIKSIGLIATPTRQLRVYLTVKKYFPNALLLNLPPKSALQIDELLHNKYEINFDNYLIGELERVIKYPELGFSSYIKVPKELKDLITIIK